VATIGGSFYMLDYSLSPRADRSDTAACFKKLFRRYPETRPWIDSLRRQHALRDTFLTMPSGERHHALYIWNGSSKTALVLHGWRNCSVDILFIARIYDQEIGGYNVVIPDFHAHGLSEGDMIQMGWLDRKDMLHWLSEFQTDTMVVHGISMGGATTMMMSAEPLPERVKDIHFIDDCGYTSVWDEFAGELKNQFGLPEFPLMYTSSLLCRLRYGWSFQEASAISEVSKSPHPMLFIHGNKDTFVPTEMVYRLYDAKPSDKALWIADDAIHAQAYKMHKSEYVEHIRQAVSTVAHP
jgi:esterase/lipase